MPSKRIGFISTRLAGTDGVSLETAKLTTILERLGYQSFYCAGELDPAPTGSADTPGGCYHPNNTVPPSPGNVSDSIQATTPRVAASHLVPEMHFTHPDVAAIHDASFGLREPPPHLHSQISNLSSKLLTHLHRFVTEYQIDVLFIQNALAIPMNIPLGVALTEFVEETSIPAIAHNHDLYWERERFRNSHIPDILERCFPPALPSLRHVVINSIAQRELIRRKGVDSVVLPNIFDFAHAAPGPDTFNQDLRQTLGLTDNHLFILQPTRVIPRKGIELSIELVRRLREPENLSRLGKDPVLVITHHAGDEGFDYLQRMQRLAEDAGVPLLYAAGRFAPQRAMKNGNEIYSLWDAYIHADFVTYPSLLEGFGNALIETIYFRLPALVNRYEVYREDIGPLGFDFVEIEGKITDETVEACIQAIADPVLRRQMEQWNYHLARQHFSYEAVMPVLAELMNDLSSSVFSGKYAEF